MVRCYGRTSGISRWMRVAMSALCLLVGVPLFMSEALKAPDMAGLRVLCGLLGMGGLILTPFALLNRCFENWDRK